MPSTINASVSPTTGIITTADSSGVLALQSNGTTGLTLSTTLAIGVGSSPSYGSSGQLLQSNGSAAAPSWTTPNYATKGNAIAFSIIFGL
jgi:hypothetical protein